MKFFYTAVGWGEMIKIDMNFRHELICNLSEKHNDNTTDIFNYVNKNISCYAINYNTYLFLSSNTIKI